MCGLTAFLLDKSVNVVEVEQISVRYLWLVFTSYKKQFI